ncbi:MAG: NAD-dependent epimerase/dehydratase family protein [OM182 bacterium]|uniref:NAD-dependent epimerase/dehydratase family protein n=1 Tax=OM182 bacterium TaxID=2510334 RepID=A0A520S171_9GAMM|nr:MAG: NAD-dependent epimerase/dehydratase family protein [OM182 bacterium]
MKISITGANSSVGINLLGHLSEIEGMEVIAGVRSNSAFASLPQSPAVTPTTISYDDSASLEQALAGTDCVIHLAGILIENKHSNYASANVAATAAVVEAAKAMSVKHIIFISVVGASASSSNAYFRSKGAAEELVLNSGLAGTVVRTPILMGPGTAGASSLIGTASSGQAKVLGGGDYSMRPLDTDDLSSALIKLATKEAEGSQVFELVGPEAIAYKDLIKKTAGLMGKEVEVGSVPVLFAKIGAAIGSTIKGGGITPTVIDVITMNEVVSQNADSQIGISLTPLQDTLTKILNNE